MTPAQMKALRASRDACRAARDTLDGGPGSGPPKGGGTGGSPPASPEYNESSVKTAINKASRYQGGVGAGERKAIHRLLKGRR